MPTNPDLRNDQLWSLLKEKNAKKTEFMQKPYTWLQSLQQQCIKTYLSTRDIKKLVIVKTTSTARDPKDILKFLDENPQLSLETITSGLKGELLVPNHFKGFTKEEDEEKKYFTLNGKWKRSHLELTPSDTTTTLKNKIATVPNLEHCVENKENDIMNTSIENNTEKEIITNSINILPPNIAKMP